MKMVSELHYTTEMPMFCFMVIIGVSKLIQEGFARKHNPSIPFIKKLSQHNTERRTKEN